MPTASSSTPRKRRRVRSSRSLRPRPEGARRSRPRRRAIVKLRQGRPTIRVRRAVGVIDGGSAGAGGLRTSRSAGRDSVPFQARLPRRSRRRLGRTTGSETIARDEGRRPAIRHTRRRRPVHQNTPEPTRSRIDRPATGRGRMGARPSWSAPAGTNRQRPQCIPQRAISTGVTLSVDRPAYTGTALRNFADGAFGRTFTSSFGDMTITPCRLRDHCGRSPARAA